MIPSPEHDGGGDGVERDRGAALVLMLTVMIVASLIVLPILDYGLAVTRSSRVVQAKATRIEAVKGGLRVALSDPINLYKLCADSGDTVGVALAGPGLATSISSRCYELAASAASDPKQLRYGVTTTQVGALPPAGIVGSAYPGSGLAPESTWRSVASTESTADKVWVPTLAAHALNRRPAGGYSMPSPFPECTVYFPGTYLDPVVITGNKPVFFTSGIYYFEHTVRFSGSARVVIGGGASQGCTNDQEAAFNANNAPTAHSITGLGATFIFGKDGRLIVDTASNGSGIDVVFNQRYVNTTDESSLPSAGVSIMTVNGEKVGSGTQDLIRGGLISVPLSSAVGGQTLAAQEYVPSRFVPEPAPQPAPNPVVELNLTTATAVRLAIPGYVAVPQGRVSIAVSDAAAAANKDVRIIGGVLSATLEVSAIRPATLELGLLNPVVQRTFKIVSRTTAGAPQVVSNAVVQVNQNGAYAVNTWEVQ